MRFYAGNDDQPTDVRKYSPLLRGYSEHLAPHSQDNFPQRVWNADESDVFALPLVWSVYATEGQLARSVAFAAEAERARKAVLLWHTGDLNPIVPFRNYLMLANAVDRCRHQKNWYVAPRFIEDPLQTFSQGQLTLRTKSEKPLIGFCGYASISAVKLAYSVVLNLKFRADHAIGKSVYEPPPVIPATVLRAKVLEKLDHDSRVETNFIVHGRYKAGAYRADRTHSSVMDFFGNILDTDYTVCVRGYGNWSVRFYETLACGRIPLFIDTDGGLPFDQTIDWRRYCVWVPANDIERLADYVSEFHNRLSNEEFQTLQRECRNIWETRLTLKGFLLHLEEYWKNYNSDYGGTLSRVNAV